ncbi:MAG: SDR family oxidoreductase, partial [Myxococcales bacterium]|nr:SDR family oxidoreductase [Myxococcales bacterium]
VNAIAPGPILFPEGSSDNVKATALARTLLGREGGAGEIAEAVWYLTAVTDFVTGALLPVDGGRHIA